MPSPSLTKPELAILKVLWPRGVLSAREVHDLVAGDLGWSYSTTRTTLERMCEKALLSRTQVHGLAVYEPAVDKVATLGGLIRDFARRVLEMDGPLPAAMFARSRLLSEEDLAELEALLESFEGKGRKE